MPRTEEDRRTFIRAISTQRRRDKRQWLAQKAAELVAADDVGNVKQAANIRKRFFGKKRQGGNTQPNKCEGCNTAYEEDADLLGGWYQYQNSTGLNRCQK